MKCRLTIGRVAAGGILLAFCALVQAAGPAVGPNVNMVQGTKWPQGDPFLTKQNEPSIAVSSRNPRHLMAGANDYRLVPVEIAEELDDPEAWIQIYKSIDGGATWRATPLGGCPLNIPECRGPAPGNNTALGDPYGLSAPLKQYKPNFGADATVRPGPYGTFFLSFIAGTRDTSSNGVVAVQRFVDKNNDIQRVTDTRTCTTPGSNGCTTIAPGVNVVYKPAEDPIVPDVMNIIDVGTPGQGKDKPWVVADVGRRSWNANKTCNLLSWTSTSNQVSPAQETNVGAFNVYVTYANFQGNSTQPDIFVAVSNDCGTTFAKPLKLTSGASKNQGTSSAIDPITGAVYVVWRQFANPAAKPPLPDAIMLSKSVDGGKTWNAGKVPTQVATLIPYDQGATAVSFRTLDFPSVAVSVDKNGQSRVHVAWAQREAAPSTTAPYACTNVNNPEKCDARIVVATSSNGGQSFGAPVKVDGNVASPTNPANPLGRGHQVQASLTFAAGKLLATWLDQRLDQTEGVLQCQLAQCKSASDLVEVRRAAKNSNLDKTTPWTSPHGNSGVGCHVELYNSNNQLKSDFAGLTDAQRAQLESCYNPNAVWSTYITDGTPGLVRRHTVDLYSAMADPADTPVFESSRVSQYTFGNTAQTTPGTYPIVQKEVNAPNLPMFSNGKSAFIGDYIDSAGQLIVATGDASQPYKFNAGVTSDGAFVAGGYAPAFHVAFTDNRDVIPPSNGDWSTPTCLKTAFDPKDPNSVTSSSNQCFILGPDGKTLQPTGLTSGTAGNRNQNIYTAAIAQHSVAFASANSKLLETGTERSFVITVRNFSDPVPGLANDGRWYRLTPIQPAGGKAAFRLSELSGSTFTPVLIFVQPKSAAARNLWVKASPTATVKVLVESGTVTNGNFTVDSVSSPTKYTTSIVLNPDPNAPLVTNGDGGGAQTDTALDNIGNVVLSNAVLTNNVLSNNALTNNALSNNALTNAVLSNVVLSNAALSDNALTNAALSNVVLSNNALSNNVLSNAVLSNVVLSNNTLNAALTNLDPANVALSNAVLSNNALTNVALTNNDPSNVVLTNNALTNAVLSNVVLSNNALSNNALSNNALSNVALSNAPLGDGTQRGDPDALTTIETGAVEITKNSFETGDLQNSNFKETTFTIRNRGNTDTILSIKLMLRDAICSGAPAYTCTTPPGYKLQLVLRKVNLLPVAIPPTGPATSTGRDLRLGIFQANTEVSNVSDLPLIDPSDPNFGKFLPDDPKAAMLSLAAGEYAYATVRAIGVGGAAPPDPAELLQWGVKTVSSNATTATSPLFITSFSAPPIPAFTARAPQDPATLQASALKTFGGKVTTSAGITGSGVCTDKTGAPILSGFVTPDGQVTAGPGTFYIDTAAKLIYGPKTGTDSHGWGTSSPQIVPVLTGVGSPENAVTASTGSYYIDTATKLLYGPKVQSVNPNNTGWGLPAPELVPLTSGIGSPEGVLSAAPGSYFIDTAAQKIYGPKAGTGTTPTTTGWGSPTQLGLPTTFLARLSCPTALSIGPSGDGTFTTNTSTQVSTSTLNFITPNYWGDFYVTLSVADASTPKQTDRQVVKVHVNPRPPVITFPGFPSSGQIRFDETLNLNTAVATDSPVQPTFAASLSVTNACYVDGSNILHVDRSLTDPTGAGNPSPCVVTVSQGGNETYAPITVQSPTITVTQATQTITFGALAGRTYGDAPFAVSATTATSASVPSPNPVTFSTTSSACNTGSTNGTTVTITNAGSCTVSADQAASSNYLAAPSVSQAFTVAPKPASVTPAANSKTYGDADPPLTGTLSGFVASDGVTASYARTAGETVADSPYTISVVLGINPGRPLTNYAITYNPANFTILPKPASVTADAKSKIYGSGDPALTGTLSGFLPGDGVTATYTRIAGENVAGSPYTISATLNPVGVLTNYAITHNTANLTITPAPLQFTVDPIYFTLFGDTTTTVTGKLSRPGFPSVFPSDAPTIAVTANSTTLTSTAPGSTDGTFTATGATPATGTYDLAFSYQGIDGNFQTGATANAKLRIEGFSIAGNMAMPRARHTSTLLNDGRVLIAGGYSDGAGTATASFEVYCPDTLAASMLPQCPGGLGAFGSFTGTTMTSGSEGHTATLLQNGKVLVVGGGNTDVELFDPASNTWSLVTVVLPQPLRFHTATLLPSGKVFIAGGADLTGNTKSTTYVFDPGTQTLNPGPALTVARESHTATLLTNGRVLIAGGHASAGGTTYNVHSTVDLYDPTQSANGSITSAASMTNMRFGHEATLLLPGGSVLVAGGSAASDSTISALLTSAEIYDPVANLWSSVAVADQLHDARRSFAMTPLNDGWPLAMGGFGDPTPNTQLTGSELFDPQSKKFDVGAVMAMGRAWHRATLMPDGRVLVTGGVAGGATPVPTTSAELYNGPPN